MCGIVRREKKFMKRPLQSKQTNNERLNQVVSTCLIVAFVIKLFYTTRRFLRCDFGDSYEYSEFLINFQGGFVRRGLLGEILYQIYSVVNYPIPQVLMIISYLAFFFVLFFFFRQFHRQRYCWWILLSPLFLGFTHYIVRKDYILYAILIGGLYLLRTASPTAIKRIGACILILFGLFLHEAFIFWGFPIYALLLLSYRCDKIFNCILAFLPVAVFLILSLYKGTTDTAYAIVDSWNSLLPETPLVHTPDNSIGALGWNLFDTFLFHLRKNANTLGGGYIVLPIYALVAYYMFTNFLTLFSPKADNDKLVLSLLYSSVLLCLIPMFTILSCDNGRVFQYASIATFSTFLIIPHNTIISAFPRWYIRFVQRFDAALNRFLPPSKGLMVLLLLFIGMSPCHFSIVTCWLHSVIGTIGNELIALIKIISSCLIH